MGAFWNPNGGMILNGKRLSKKSEDSNIMVDILGWVLKSASDP